MTAVMLSKVLMLAVVGVATVAAVVLARWSPKSLTVIFVSVYFFLPIWVGVSLGTYFPAFILVTLLIIVGASWSGLELSHVDVLVIAFAAILGWGTALEWLSPNQSLAVFTGWIIPYVAGRLIRTQVDPKWIYTCLAGGASLAALMGIVEFLTGHNLFIHLGPGTGLHSTWGSLQYRGGLLRTEGAFGHSIAFGASLSMCSAFILVTRWPAWLKLSCLAVVSVAVGLTFSRIGIISLGLTVIGSIVFLRRYITSQFRVLVIICFSSLAIIGIPQLVQVFGEAGDEAAGSAAYRGNLYSLIPAFSAVGTSQSWTVLPNGESYYGQFQSIDSELVLTALRFGFVPLLMLLGMLLSTVISIARGKASPASIALAAQIPSFATVALITQYANFIWFVGGLAVATYSASTVAQQTRSSSSNFEVAIRRRTI
ncbi:hypothetical protein [Arthrobacter sp.]|uniref:hypothetical protein n=1 Tax=Arthrobacter sp. TaxID=1667 RepID=UPI003A93D0B4